MNDLQRLMALEDIRTLCSLYCHHRDQLDLDALVDLFTVDAVCEFAPRLGGALVGQEAIRTHFRGSMQRSAGGTPFRTLHTVTNPWIVFTGEDAAQGRCFLTSFSMRDPAVNPLAYLGVYDDEYRRVNGAWKLQRRRLDIAWPDAEASAGAPGQRVSRPGQVADVQDGDMA